MSAESTASVPTMRTIALIACGKGKLSCRAQAQRIYVGALFVKSLAYAGSFNPDAIYILSAKHGLLEREQEIDPYDMSLKTMTRLERKAWADRVYDQLKERSDLKRDRFVILAGKRYRDDLTNRMTHVELPLAGLSIGRQLQFLTPSPT